MRLPRPQRSGGFGMQKWAFLRVATLLLIAVAGRSFADPRGGVRCAHCFALDDTDQVSSRM
jgi:hypothetical protein